MPSLQRYLFEFTEPVLDVGVGHRVPERRIHETPVCRALPKYEQQIRICLMAEGAA